MMALSAEGLLLTARFFLHRESAKKNTRTGVLTTSHQPLTTPFGRRPQNRLRWMDRMFFARSATDFSLPFTKTLHSIYLLLTEKGYA
jgi:hypothetical protein